uniref:C2 domain-containing protein n=1 Tax=Coptotermes formosanus TaxID=36987 RepID=R4UVW2_COPFO|nr:C2 domain-containing protein [Coptotermes formosanus]
MTALHVRLLEGQDLPVKDADGNSDPYAILWLNGNRKGGQRSQTIENSLNPVWNEEFSFPVKEVTKEYFFITLFDEDPLSDDEMSRWRTPLAPIAQNVTHDLWVNLYQATHPGVKGRLHLQIHLGTGEKFSAPAPTFNPTNLNIKVQHAVELPKLDPSNPYVKIKIANTDVESVSDVRPNTNRPVWDQDFTLPLQTNDSLLKIELWNKDKSEERIGEIDIHLSLYEQRRTSYDYYVLYPVNKKKGGYLALKIQLAPEGVPPFQDS